MRLGGHFPISGGLEKSVRLTVEAGGNVLQIFSKNPGQWKGSPISPEKAGLFKDAAASAGVFPVIVHDTYLINLASQDAELLEKSRRAFVEEIERAACLGAEYLVTHMGAHGGRGEEEGLLTLARSVEMALSATSGLPVGILLETTAGQGTQLGWRFEHLARVMSLCGGSPRVGASLDTCHVFAAGYDLGTDEGYEKTLEEFDRLIGLHRLGAIHTNDARKGLGSRVDRHAHIGEGALGISAFRRIMNDPRLRDVPLIVETPEPEKMHKVNIALLKSLVET
jgi:deoxyribonuclease-4